MSEIYDNLNRTTDSVEIKYLSNKETKKPKQRRRGNPAHSASMKKHKVWEKSPFCGFNGYADTQGQRAKIAAALLDFDVWGKPNLNSIPELEERFKQYLQYCIENDMIVSNLTAYYALGISKETAYDWERGIRRGKEHTDFIKRVKNVCASYREMAAADGLIDRTIVIWWQKNFDGFVDNQVLTVQTNNPLGDEVSPEELQKRIEGNIVVDDFEVNDE